MWWKKSSRDSPNVSCIHASVQLIYRSEYLIANYIIHACHIEDNNDAMKSLAAASLLSFFIYLKHHATTLKAPWSEKGCTYFREIIIAKNTWRWILWICLIFCVYNYDIQDKNYKQKTNIVFGKNFIKKLLKNYKWKITQVENCKYYYLHCFLFLFCMYICTVYWFPLGLQNISCFLFFFSKKEMILNFLICIL
jgi:hypothetical protein